MHLGKLATIAGAAYQGSTWLSTNVPAYQQQQQPMLMDSPRHWQPKPSTNAFPLSKHSHKYAYRELKPLDRPFDNKFIEQTAPPIVYNGHMFRELLSSPDHAEIESSVISKWSRFMTGEYFKESRYYHSHLHVARMLKVWLGNTQEFMHEIVTISEFKTVKDGEYINDVIQLAIHFHDVVYDATRTDNELRSVDMFQEFAGDARVFITEEIKEAVSMLIMATIKHMPPSVGDVKSCSTHRNRMLLLPMSRAFLDLDLEVLSWQREEYLLKYSDQIRKEYKCYADAEYRAGRVRVLESFLTRPTLYFTQFMHQKSENDARSNLQHEIDSLTKVSEAQKSNANASKDRHDDAKPSSQRQLEHA